MVSANVNWRFSFVDFTTRMLYPSLKDSPLAKLRLACRLLGSVARASGVGHTSSPVHHLCKN